MISFIDIKIWQIKIINTEDLIALMALNNFISKLILKNLKKFCTIIDRITHKFFPCQSSTQSD